MIRNIANQYVHALLLTSAGAAVTTGTTNVFVSRDGNAQAAGGNTTATHLGNGVWRYTTTATDTDGDHVSFVFVNAGGVNANVNYVTIDATVDAVLKATYRTVCRVTTGSGSTTTSVVVSALNVGGATSIQTDALAGRWIYFRGDTTTAALQGGTPARILANTSGATPTLTLDGTTPLVAAPVSGDLAVIV